MGTNKVLIRVSNLKQYFPLKKKGMYVKANDGITLDIYEGETFGLVGESGCGKSTLGRTLLQFYKQTDGRTMYYGRSVEEFAPGYVKSTISHLEKRRKEYRELEAKRVAAQEAYDKLDEQAQYQEKEKLDKITKEANDAFLDMANIVGGLMLAENLKPVQDIYLKRFDISVTLKKNREKRQGLELDLADAAYLVKTRGEAGKNTAGAQSKVDAANGAIKAVDAEIEKNLQALSAVDAEIQEMKKPYANAHVP